MGRILEAGRNTPSPGNVQTLEFVVVEDNHKLDMLAQAMGDHRIGEAPSTVLVVIDQERMERKVGKKAREFCMMESAVAVQNMRLVAQEEGISSVWKTGFDTQTVSEQFAVTNQREVVASVSFAYSEHPVHSEPRFGMNEVVYYDEYGNQIKSVFDGIEWKGLQNETKIYGKKVRGVLSKLRRKVEEVL